jgi:hypothetical protein
VKKTALAVLIMLLLTAFAMGADVYQTGKVVKWDKGTYPDGKKTKPWIVYQIQGDTMQYSVARHKETQPKMQPGDVVQLEVKGNKATVIDAQGHKEEYQVVGQAQGSGQ